MVGVEPKQNLVSRHIEPLILEALADTPVVVIQGARQVGKSTLARAIADREDGVYVTLDDELQRAAAERDPVTFVQRGSDAMLVIDEVQRVPSLILAIKAAVDRDRRAGRFLLTGSADLLRIGGADSLAGRAESVELFGLSQGERRGRRERFVDRLLDGDLMVQLATSAERTDVLNLACAGGYPEASSRPVGRRRSAWFASYATRITERDAGEVSRLRHLGELRTILEALAAHSAEVVSVATIARDASVPDSTLPPYLELLEALYLTRRIPLWSNNHGSRVRRSRKSILLDSGLTAELLNVTAEALAVDIHPDPAGRIVETFAFGEVLKQVGWSERHPRVMHWSEPRKGEVDIVLEAPGGSIAGIEVKAAATVGDADFKGLRRLRAAAGTRFAGGVVLFCGEQSVPWGQGFAALPISALWDA